MVFHESVLNKVVNYLEDRKISYQIINKDKNPVVKNYKNLNDYKNILKKSVEYQDIRVRVLRIIEKINAINEVDKLESIIKVLENEID